MSCGCQTTSSNCVREPFNANFVRPLTYVRGVDVNGCVSYAPIGNFAINIQDTQSVDLTLAGGVLSANVIISPNAGNALQSLANGLYVPQGNYSLSNCAGSPLPIGTQVLTCPSAPSALNINNTLLSFASPNTGQRTMSAKQCPEPQNNEYIIIADNAGNVRYTAMREAVAYNLTAGNPIVFPNIPLITLQPPNTNTGVIDSASFTNPLNCYGVFPKGVLNGLLQHSFNANGTSEAIARISGFRDLDSRIDNINTPGITNTPLTGHAWRNQTIVAGVFTAERIIDLGAAVAPGATLTYNRALFVLYSTNFYYVTAEDWGASFAIVKI